MATSCEVLSLATPRGATMGKFGHLSVSRLLKNVFATIVGLKMVSDTDAHTKLQSQSTYTFM